MIEQLTAGQIGIAVGIIGFVIGIWLWHRSDKINQERERGEAMSREVEKHDKDDHDDFQRPFALT